MATQFFSEMERLYLEVDPRTELAEKALVAFHALPDDVRFTVAFSPVQIPHHVNSFPSPETFGELLTGPREWYWGALFINTVQYHSRGYVIPPPAEDYEFSPDNPVSQFFRDLHGLFMENEAAAILVGRKAHQALAKEDRDQVTALVNSNPRAWYCFLF